MTTYKLKMTTYNLTRAQLDEALQSYEIYKHASMEKIRAKKWETKMMVTVFSDSNPYLNEQVYDILEAHFSHIENLLLNRVTFARYKELVYTNQVAIWENDITLSLNKKLNEVQQKVLKN